MICSAQKQSAYGRLEPLDPLSPAQLNTPADHLPSSRTIKMATPISTQTSTPLYKNPPVAGPQMLLEATQAMVQEAIELVSPRKSKIADPLIKQKDSSSRSSGILNIIPPIISSLWSSKDDKAGISEMNRGVEVTKSITEAPASSKRRPPAYGGAYATSPYHIPRPTHVEISDFPSPSRTPYQPHTTSTTTRYR